MAKLLLELKDNEVFIPVDMKSGKGRIIQLHELQRGGRTLVNINQYQAIREAQRENGNVMSLAEDWRAYLYAKQHQDDERLKAYYESVSSKFEYARWTSTQVHELRSDNPFVVNVAEVHPEFNLPFYKKEDVISVPWLPKKDGYIQELDEETGLPREIRSKPNHKFDNSLLYIEYVLSEQLDVVAAVRYWNGSGHGLDLGRGPGYVDDGLGVRVAKNSQEESLERRVRTVSSR